MSAAFHVCKPKWFQSDMLRTYRCYVAGTELLAFPSGLASMAGGLLVPLTDIRLVGAIPTKFGRMLPGPALETQRTGIREYERSCELEGLDEAALLQEADRRKDTLILSAKELGRVLIEPPPWWFGWLRGFDCPALLKLGGRQPQVLALATPKDARTAAQELARLLGDALVVNLAWGAASKKV